MPTAEPFTCPDCRPICSGCHRCFDLLDEDDAAEWIYGHDCEESE